MKNYRRLAGAAATALAAVALVVAAQIGVASAADHSQGQGDVTTQSAPSKQTTSWG